MCSIAAFSFSDNSKFDARRLASALLIAGESRGKHASGYAYMHGQIGVLGNSAAERASKFVRTPAFELPSAAKTVLLHTRYATQGRPENNLNNHPVFAFGSQGEAVAAVHNGCIWNDYTLFRQYKDEFTRIAEVDSEIIPQLLLHKGSANYAEVLKEIQGSVATAWLDEETGDTLHVARAVDSPVCIAVVDEPRRVSRRGHKRNRLHGVIIASTFEMLRRGLATLGLDAEGRYVRLYQLNEGQYFSVTKGEWDVKVHDFALPEGGYSRWDAGLYDEWGSDGHGWSSYYNRQRSQTNRKAGTSRYYMGGTVSQDTAKRRDDAYAAFTGSESGDYYREGYNAATGEVYTSHNGVLVPAPELLDNEYPDGVVMGPRDNEPSEEELYELEHRHGLDPAVEFTVTTPKGESRVVTLSDILDARDKGTLSEAEAEVFMHLEYCEEDQCILLDSMHCPVVQKQAPLLVSNPIHNRADRDIQLTADKIVADWNKELLAQ